MWECGLKQGRRHIAGRLQESLLMWECGLKPLECTNIEYDSNVTPYVGVWIETSRVYKYIIRL